MHPKIVMLNSFQYQQIFLGDRIILCFQSLAKKSGSITITLPEKSNMQNAMVIAYIQRQNTFEITGADKLPL